MTHTPEDRVTVNASQKDLVKRMTKRDLCFAHTVVKDVDEKQGLAFVPRRLTENERVLIEQLRTGFISLWFTALPIGNWACSQEC